MGARPLTPRDDFDPKVAEIIQIKAAKLSRTGGFAPGDREDLGQELALHVTAVWGRFDPARASAATFADRVLARKAVDLARAAGAAKRDRRRQQSLDAAPEGVLARYPCSGGRLDRAIDVREAVARLPEELRRVAELLETWGVVEAARLAGMSRQQIRTAVKRIREHLRDRGLAPDGANNLKAVTIRPAHSVNISTEETVSA